MLINCTVCGRLFRQKKGDICSRCLDAGSDYETIKEYLYKNRGASAVEIAIATGVPVSTLLKLINDEYLTIIAANKDKNNDNAEKSPSKSTADTSGSAAGQNSRSISARSSKFGQRARRR